MNQTLETKMFPYVLVRAEATADTPIALATSEGDFANMPASGVLDIATSFGGWQGECPANMLEWIFAGDTAGDTFVCTMYAYRTINGPARQVASIAGTIGTMDVVAFPTALATAVERFWADTLVVTDTWLKTVSAADNGAANRCSAVQFDTCGYRYFYPEITTDDNITVFASSY